MTFLEFDRRVESLVAPALVSERVEIPSLGTLAYRANRAGSGRALVFLHGLDPGAGSYEFSALQSAFSNRPTYALDWFGYGESSAPQCGPNADGYADALAAFIERVAAPDGQAVDVIACARACEFSALVALRRPRPIRSLVLLSPTGFGPARRFARLAQFVRELQRAPRVCDVLYRACCSKPGILASLSRFVGGKSALELARRAPQATATATSGAYSTSFSFLEAALSAQVAGVELYRALRVPTFVLFDQSAKRSFEFLPEATRDNAFIRSLRLGSRHGAPHLESTAVVQSAAHEFHDALDIAARFEDWESMVETVPSYKRREHQAA